MSKALVSFITPVYNREKYIAKCLESIFVEVIDSGVPVEVIVVDDGSKDSSFQVAERTWKTFFNGHELGGLVNFKIMKLDSNMGVNAARNRGVEFCNGEWVFFLDSDNYLMKGSLSSMREVFSSVDADIFFFETVSLSTGDKMDSIKDKDRYISYKEYICKEVGELTPVFKSDIARRFKLFEDINGGEGIYWAYLLKLGFRGYLSSLPVRLYDESPSDRLSVRGKNLGRLAKVYRKYMEYQFVDLLRSCPARAFVLLSKFLFYNMVGFLG